MARRAAPLLLLAVVLVALVAPASAACGEPGAAKEDCHAQKKNLVDTLETIESKNEDTIAQHSGKCQQEQQAAREAFQAAETRAAGMVANATARAEKARLKRFDLAASHYKEATAGLKAATEKSADEAKAAKAAFMVASGQLAELDQGHKALVAAATAARTAAGVARNNSRAAVETTHSDALGDAEAERNALTTAANKALNNTGKLCADQYAQKIDFLSKDGGSINKIHTLLQALHKCHEKPASPAALAAAATPAAAAAPALAAVEEKSAPTGLLEEVAGARSLRSRGAAARRAARECEKIEDDVFRFRAVPAGSAKSDTKAEDASASAAPSAGTPERATALASVSDDVAAMKARLEQSRADAVTTRAQCEGRGETNYKAALKKAKEAGDVAKQAANADATKAHQVHDAKHQEKMDELERTHKTSLTPLEATRGNATELNAAYVNKQALADAARKIEADSTVKAGESQRELEKSATEAKVKVVKEAEKEAGRIREFAKKALEEDIKANLESCATRKKNLEDSKKIVGSIRASLEAQGLTSNTKKLV